MISGTGPSATQPEVGLMSDGKVVSLRRDVCVRVEDLLFAGPYRVITMTPSGEVIEDDMDRWVAADMKDRFGGVFDDH